MLSLKKFLSLKKYRKMSVEKLCDIIGYDGDDCISFEDYKKLPGKFTLSKAENLYRKWHKKPLKNKVAASSTSSNISYTAALREKCRKYFAGVDNRTINNFIKSVQRLNAAEKRRTAHN